MLVIRPNYSHLNNNLPILSCCFNYIITLHSGMPGMKGAPGDKGADGQDGANGQKGIDGEKGLKGSTGV
jgi:hypothetical protein